MSDSRLDEQPFLAAIVADPDSDAPRIAYANWLSSHRDPLGAFIRLGCEQNRLDRFDRRHAELERQRKQFLEDHGKTWTAPLAAAGLDEELCRECIESCERGCMEWVPVPAKGWFPDRVRTLFDMLPLLHRMRVAISDQSEALHVAASRWLERLDHLKFETDLHVIDSATFCTIMRSPHLSRLKNLEFGFIEIGSVGSAAFADANLPDLTELEIWCSKIGPRGAALLAASPNVRRLSRLSIPSSDIGPEGLAELVAVPMPLRHLNLSSGDLGPEARNSL